VAPITLKVRISSFLHIPEEESLDGDPAIKDEGYAQDTGKPVDEMATAGAAEAALAEAKPLSMKAYKIEIAKTLVKRAILETRQP
jgi:CO/xanthine dehydrogenase FAD-binding subunit